MAVHESFNTYRVRQAHSRGIEEPELGILKDHECIC